ncbi:hypothetical protein [Virgibacillus sp. CBA3643]|uniref:hypothetical protein n=1 Tax=Virgibacillus sp. CBA3643 TaxID=2942278 RepID=UPI0035A36C37
MTVKDDFTRFFTLYRHYSDKKVESVELKVSAEDVRQGEIYVTDLQLQEGNQATGEIPNTRDVLKLETFNIDEKQNAVSGGNVYQGDEPQVFTDKTKRFFNVMGRGFETIAIPNVFHEDYRKELLTTGLDLTLWPKDDYDFLRVSTFYGGTVEDDNKKTYTDETLSENPLNKRYTREFCFSGGNVGDEIKINASGQYASVNGNLVPLGVQRFDVGQESDYNGSYTVQYKNRQRFMALPVGATRIKIDFMKKEQQEDLIYMVNGGIGFHGLAEFTQWSWGASKF